MYEGSRNLRSNYLKTAKAQLRAVGRDFLARFSAAQTGVTRLRSRSPAACWPVGDRTYFYAIQEKLGPHTSRWPTQLELVQLLMNTSPPPGLLYYLRGLSADRPLRLAEGPKLELVALPSELPAFGTWLAEWLTAQATPGAPPPIPPFVFTDDHDYRPWTSWVNLDPEWRRFDFFWTDAAKQTPLFKLSA